MLGTVIQIDGFDPATNAGVTLRAASHDDARICHLDGKLWWPMLAKLPELKYDFFDGAFGGQITAPASDLTLQVEAWPAFARYQLADARIQLWTGDIGGPWSGWTQRVDGRLTEQPEAEGGVASVAFAVDDRWLDTPLLATYAGTTGAEGPIALKGQVKPLALGAPKFVSGVLVNAVSSIFQISGHGPVEAVDAALERVVRFGAPIADYPSYTALDAATIPRGAWATANAVGMARFGAPPTGTVTFMVRGDRAGPDGWVRLPGRIIRRLAMLAGGAGRISEPSLAALDVARPYNQSIYLDQQTTGRDIIQQLANGVNAVAVMSWLGKLHVLPIGIGAPTLSLAADGSALPPVERVRRLGIAAPFRKLAMGAEKTWTVHPLSDVAFTAELVPMGDYAAGTTYREGNIVQKDGATWLYIATTPGAGNAPPDPTYWKVLAAAGQDGASAWTLTGSGGMEWTQSTARKRSATAAFDEAVYSTQTIPGGVAISFRPAQADKTYAVGLTTAPGSSADLSHLRFAFLVRRDGMLQIFENGQLVEGIGGYAQTNILQIIYDGKRIRYRRNGLTFRDQPAPAGLALGLSSSFFDVGGEIYEITLSASGQAGEDGASAPLVRTQWSIDGATNWHDNYFGADRYARQSNDNGATWGPAELRIGERGDAGTDGKYTSRVYLRSFTVPATPASNTGDPPPGWTDGPTGTAANGYLFEVGADFRNGIQLTGWSAPVRIDGEAGKDGFALSADHTEFNIPAFSNGAIKPSWGGAGGILSLNRGGYTQTDGVTYALLTNQNVAGVSVSGRSFSFSGVASEKGSFVIRATYAGQPYDVRIDVKKTLDGAAAFQATAQINGQNGGGEVTVPAGRTVQVSAYSDYYPQDGYGTQTSRLAIYYRNVTDGGPEVLLQSVTGSQAYRFPANGPEGTETEQAGSVSASGSFTSASPDKLYAYRAFVTRESGSSGFTVSYSGQIKLEVL